MMTESEVSMVFRAELRIYVLCVVVVVCLGKLFLHGFCLVAQMSMRTRTTFPLTE